jgi:hypothetical protein
MKRSLSIFFIALLSFLLLSCGDGKTTSGIDTQTTAVVAQSSSAENESSLPEGVHEVTDTVLQGSIPPECSTKFKNKGLKTKYTNLPFYKALAKNDKTNQLTAGWGYSDADVAKEAVLGVCKIKTGSICRLVDEDGKQCKDSSGVSDTGTLKITSPNGGQKLQIGKKYTIKWIKGNGGGYVRIELLKSGKGYKAIHKKTKNDGRYRWNIPVSVTTGSQYKIKITSISKKNVSDASDTNFTISKTSSSGGSKNYRFLQKHNAYLLGYAYRYKSKVIKVSGAKSAMRRAAVNRWKPTVRFRFSSKRVKSGIHIKYGALPANQCGVARNTLYISGEPKGEVVSCSITLETEGRCIAAEADNLTHEVGHCLGFKRHTTDGGIMDASATASNRSITAPVRNMIKLLYSLPPGTNIKPYL